jgi:hypothetical protein
MSPRGLTSETLRVGRWPGGHTFDNRSLDHAYRFLADVLLDPGEDAPSVDRSGDDLAGQT